MIRRKLIEIQHMVKGSGLNENQAFPLIEGVSTDSRSIQKNQLFIPIVGDLFNGHDYLEKAAEKGAAAALWNRSEPPREAGIPLIFVEDTVQALQQLAKEYRRQLGVKIIGITGSNGKTSTKDILAGILSQRYQTHKTKGNLNNHLGVPLTLLEMDGDTEVGVIEMGMSDLGEIRLLTDLSAPDAAMITNIGEAHLDYLKTKDRILQAKLEILEGLQPGGLFVYPAVEPFLSKLPKGLLKPFEVISFGEGTAYRPYGISLEEKGVRFFVEGMGNEAYFLPLVGRHQVQNAVGAMIIARYFKLTNEELRKGLLKVDATGARNEIIEGHGLTVLNDSYKSNPLSLKAALDTLYGLKSYSQKIAVLGDMNGLGDQAADLHEQAAIHLDPRQLDYVFTVGSISEFMARAAAPYFEKGRVVHCHTIEEAEAHLQQVVEEKSIVLVKGSREQAMERLVEDLTKEPFIKGGVQ